jgi:hypothetical protein
MDELKEYLTENDIDFQDHVLDTIVIYGELDDGSYSLFIGSGYNMCLQYYPCCPNWLGMFHFERRRGDDCELISNLYAATPEEVLEAIRSID